MWRSIQYLGLQPYFCIDNKCLKHKKKKKKNPEGRDCSSPFRHCYRPALTSCGIGQALLGLAAVFKLAPGVKILLCSLKMPDYFPMLPSAQRLRQPQAGSCPVFSPPTGILGLRRFLVTSFCCKCGPSILVYYLIALSDFIQVFRKIQYYATITISPESLALKLKPNFPDGSMDF